MKNRRLGNMIQFLKAFNKYLLICWSVFILVFAVYWFGFENIIKRDPLSVSAEGEDEWGVSSDWSGGVDSDEVLPPEPIKEESSSGESDEVLPPEPISQEPNAVVEEQPQEYSDTTDYGGSRESDEVSAPQPLVDSSSLDVVVVEESAPAPQPVYSAPDPTPYQYQTPYPTPTPTPYYQQPQQVVEREVVREVVRRDYEEEDRRRREEERYRATPTPTPTPTPFVRYTPTPTPTTTAVVGNQVVDGVVRVIPQGAVDSPCPGSARAVITTSRTICEPLPSIAPGPQVLAAVATPTPAPVFIAQVAPTPTPRIIPAPSPVVIFQSPSPTPRVSPTPAQIVVQASPSPAAQVQVITRQDAITIPAVAQTAVCPAGARRIDQGNQIICEVPAVQAQAQTQALAQVQTQPQKVSLVEATSAAAPKVIAQVQTPATVLPNTGLPAAALGFGSLIPLGMGLRKWKDGKGLGVSANSLWVERQLRV